MKTSKLFLGFLSIFVISLALSIHSCAKDEVEPFESPIAKTIEDENISISVDETDLGKTKSDAELTARTTCDILGTSSPQAGSQYTFTYTSNIINPTITWSVLSGSITLVSTSGSSATFQFGLGFNGGSIKAFGANGSVECSDIKSFSSVTCPQQSCLNIFEVEPCLDFQAVLGCANDVSSVDWEYSIGPYSHVSFGSSTNPNGNYSIAKPLYLPSGNWDNYYLWVFADITLTDGSTCSRSRSILLDCDTGGGGGHQ